MGNMARALNNQRLSEHGEADTHLNHAARAEAKQEVVEVEGRPGQQLRVRCRRLQPGTAGPHRTQAARG
jgi:hypothetical protein